MSSQQRPNRSKTILIPSSIQYGNDHGIDVHMNKFKGRFKLSMELWTHDCLTGIVHSKSSLKVKALECQGPVVQLLLRKAFGVMFMVN